LLKYDLREDKTQTLVRYLASFDEKIANVVELHPYTTLDELSSPTHKVEMQRKIKGKGEASKPPSKELPISESPYQIAKT